MPGADQPLAPPAAALSGENSRTIFPKVCQLNFPQITFNYPLPRWPGERQGEGGRRTGSRHRPLTSRFAGPSLSPKGREGVLASGFPGLPQAGEGDNPCDYSCSPEVTIAVRARARAGLV